MPPTVNPECWQAWPASSFYLYDAHPDVRHGLPGELLAVRDDAVLVATGDASLWIGALRRKPQPGEQTFKRPARHVLSNRLEGVPMLDGSLARQPFSDEPYQPIRYRECGHVGELTFEFYNGAMSTEQCQRLVAALRWAKSRDTQVLLVRGGRGSFFQRCAPERYPGRRRTRPGGLGQHPGHR
nr:hypothetical protein GCM10020185_02150 [Pseudomonas brassicacearum subsp. brassicacearum]